MKKIMSVMLFVCLMFSFGFVVADDSGTMTVKVNVLKSVVGISVPDEVVFPDIASGYLSERQDLDIENIGTVDISVSAELDGLYADTIFQHLAFRNILDDPLTEIRYFDFEILKPNTVGGTRSENIYMYLDLENYSGEITEDMMDHETDVTFYALPL